MGGGGEGLEGVEGGRLRHGGKIWRGRRRGEAVAQAGPKLGVRPGQQQAGRPQLGAQLGLEVTGLHIA